MWRFWLAVVGFGILIGCNSIVSPSVDVVVSRASVPPQAWAWGERVDLGINARTVVITYPGNPDGTQTFSLESNHLFDIPAPPSDTEAIGTEGSISLEMYNAPLDPTLYTKRGVLHVKNASGLEIDTYTPYGSVVNGQISFLASIVASQSCQNFYSQLTNRLNLANIPGFSILAEDSFSVPVPSLSLLCYGTVNVGLQSTNQALKLLQTALSSLSGYVPVFSGKSFVTDKNSVFNMLTIGSYSYDPNCKELPHKLDPYGNMGFGLISTTKLKADLNIIATSPTGLGVNVNIIGGGVDSADSFTCLPNYDFVKHDTHAKSLIQAIAPGVSITPYTACNSSGTCKGSELGKALMQILATNPTTPNIINMSLGSPLQNNIMYSLLELLRVRHNMPVFASGGNSRRAPAQYPASYSSGVAVIGQPSLANVISVASLGWKTSSGGYEIAAFNTRANADVFAFGVDLCPVTALGFRCSSLLPTPGNLGITGSSFSAPIQAGLAALLIQRKGGLPTDLHACVRNNRKTDSVTGIQYGALTNQACP
jgi:hypothetical protein